MAAYVKKPKKKKDNSKKNNSTEEKNTAVLVGAKAAQSLPRALWLPPNATHSVLFGNIPAEIFISTVPARTLAHELGGGIFQEKLADDELPLERALKEALVATPPPKGIESSYFGFLVDELIVKVGKMRIDTYTYTQLHIKVYLRTLKI